MRMKKLSGILAAILLVSMSITLPALAADWDWPGQPAAEAPARISAVMLAPQDSGLHIKYMTGSNGWFYPERPVTRAELAQMLDRIVADEPAVAPSFYDVPQDAWYAASVQKTAGLGLLTGRDGAFRPDEPATRAECAAALSEVIPYDVAITQSFPDVGTEHWAWYAISRTASYGLFRGDSSGNFQPDDGIKRCEVVAVFNRLLGRTPDTSYLAYHTGLRSFPDVPPSHWAYGDVMEASITHQSNSWLGFEVWSSTEEEPVVPVASITPETPDQPVAPTPSAGPALADGPQRVNGRLYWVVDGEYVRNQSIIGLSFDENGCYSTGNAELDAKLNDIVEEQTNDSMTRDQKLRALFDYVVNNFKYLSRPMVAKGTEGWEPDSALFLLDNGKGNCFNFAAAYCLLCRELGLPAYTVVGASNNADSPHGWVEIDLDGTVYMFDPELQWYYNNKTSKRYDLFMMEPGKVPAGVYRYIW